MAGALSGEAAIAAAAPAARARAAGPRGAPRRARSRAGAFGPEAAASRLPARGSSFGDANAPDGARGAPDGATPAPTNLTSHVRRAPPRASRVVPRAADGDNRSCLRLVGYETGQTEVMRSVAERVKAARELAPDLGSRRRRSSRPGADVRSAEEDVEQGLLGELRQHRHPPGLATSQRVDARGFLVRSSGWSGRAPRPEPERSIMNAVALAHDRRTP